MGNVVCRIAGTEEELRGHFAVRHAVFVDEQGLFDETDRDAYDDTALPIVAVDEETGAIVGAVRCYEAETGIWFGGRLAVLPSHRRHPSIIGAQLCKVAEWTMIQQRADRFVAYIQPQNVRFFKRLRWHVVGEPVLHCGQLHQLMEASMAGATYTRRQADIEGVTA